MMHAIQTESLADLPARERILLTAHDLFYRDGIRATGIDRIIAEAQVTKVTFYRHFPSKDELILAFLEYRHARWIGWFSEALQRHRPKRGSATGAIVPALEEWFRRRDYRGCAFINTVAELGPVLPAAIAMAQRHKQEMTDLIAGLLPASRHRMQDAQAIAMAVDGAIVRAQCDASPDAALAVLRRLIHALEENAAGQAVR